MRIVSSYSQNTKFYHCPYSHYLYTYGNGTGIINKASSMHTQFGTACHDASELLMAKGTKEEALATINKGVALIEGETLTKFPRKEELRWLGVGLILAFHRHALPQLREAYNIRTIEQEFVIPLPLGSTAENCQVLWACRPDAELERKSDEATFNCNIKTTGYMKDVQKIYEFSIQMFMEALAIKLNNGSSTGGTIILALNKGSKSGPLAADKLKGIKEGFRMDSPLTYVWWKNGTYSFNYVKGAEKIGVWEFNSSPEEWFEKLPEEIQKSQVDISMPILHSQMLNYDDVIQDIINVETAVAQNFIPKNRDSCNSYGTFNSPCDYWLWCNGTPQQRSENFIPRTANHPIEETLKEAF